LPTYDFSATAAQVAMGEGIAEAAQYSPDGSDPPRMVVISSTGSLHEWHASLSPNWTPTSIDEIELIVILAPEQEIELDTQSYVGGPPITRYRFEMAVEVREARTAIALWEGTLHGSMPGPFPQTAPVEQIRLSGSHVSYEDLEEWLSCLFIAPQECEHRTLGGHEYPGVAGLSFSPEGQILASGSRDVRLWRISDGARLQTIEDMAGSVAFSPDGDTLAARSEAGVSLLRVADSTLIQTMEVSKPTSWAFSPDGQMLATSSYDETVLRLWRISDGALLRTFDGHTAGVMSVSFSPDGLTLASASHDTNVHLWRVSNGSLLQVLEGHGNTLTSVAFSPDGAYIASGSSDLTARIWRASDGTLHQELGWHTNTVSEVAFSPDGEILATASSDGVHLWRVSDGTEVHIIEGSNVHCLAFSPDGQILAWGSRDDGRVHLWWTDELP
jgi:WD40 repeat protein